MKITLPLLVIGLAMSMSSASAQDKKPTPAAIQFFESKVRPILAQHCFECHGEKRERGGLRLDSLAAILEGGDQGPAIVPGHPEKSLLVKAINQDGKLKMPPKNKKLTGAEIDALTQWVKMGAPWPSSDKPATAKKGDYQISDKDRAHWSFQPVKRPALPSVKNQAWVRNPIDAFILAKLEAKGLSPAPLAAKHELARRLYYDLTGLPPTPKEIEAFVNDAAPDAYEKLVDKLLASPHYGEKWARHWLDLVRYAETNSYERDNPKPHIWRYRDYVIRAFNQDKPYDVFLKEQLAGDEMAFPPSPPGRGAGGEGNAAADALIATGFYRLGVWDDEPVDPKQSRYDGLDDIIATIGQTMLGMTLDCARCHNHKIDPIAQKDYYKMVAFLHGINHYRGGGPDDVRPIGNAKQMEAYKKILQEHEEKRAKTQAALTAIENEFRKLYKPAAQLVGNDLDELTYRFYRNAWTKLPDFSQFKHEDEGKLPKKLFDISPRTRNEAFGFVYEGFLIVPEDGKYTFYLDSDDGSRLTLDGKALITYDGIHGMGKVQTKSIELKKGRLPIKLEYFQNVFGYGLYVGWSGPGFEKRNLSMPESAVVADIAEHIRRDGARVLGAKRFQEWFTLEKQMKFLRKAPAGPKVDMALCVVEAGPRAPDTFLFVRGSPNNPGEKVEPGFPTVFNIPDPPIPAAKPGAKSSGRRTVLANWIASKGNPMTARVMVNRLWQQHFGRGIVRTPSDYGLHGARPTHPELLDWLASEFWIRLAAAFQGLEHEGNAPPDPDLERLPHGLAHRPEGDRARQQARPGQRPLLALRHAPPHRRGNPRFDPRHQRQSQSQSGRPRHLSADPEGRARRPIGPRPRLAGVDADGSRPPQRLRSREAFALVADPGRLRPRRARPHDAGALQLDATDASPRHVERRVPQQPGETLRRAFAARSRQGRERASAARVVSGDGAPTVGRRCSPWRRLDRCATARGSR